AVPGELLGVVAEIAAEMLDEAGPVRQAEARGRAGADEQDCTAIADPLGQIVDELWTVCRHAVSLRAADLDRASLVPAARVPASGRIRRAARSVSAHRRRERSRTRPPRARPRKRARARRRTAAARGRRF